MAAFFPGEYAGAAPMPRVELAIVSVYRERLFEIFPRSAQRYFFAGLDDLLDLQGINGEPVLAIELVQQPKGNDF